MPTMSCVLTSSGPPRIVSIDPEATARQAARLMVDEHVGTVLVRRGTQLLGIATDRDIALDILRNGLDPDATLVSQCMSSPLVTVPQSASLEEIAHALRVNRVRRLVCLDDQGEVERIVAVDDVVSNLGRRWSQLALAIERERRRESNTSDAHPSVFGRE